MTTLNEIRAAQERMIAESKSIIKWKDGFELNRCLSGIEVIEARWHRRLENKDSSSCSPAVYLEIDDTIYDRLLIDQQAESEDGQFVFIDATSGEYEDERRYQFILLTDREDGEVDARMVRWMLGL